MTYTFWLQAIARAVPGIALMSRWQKLSLEKPMKCYKMAFWKVLKAWKQNQKLQSLKNYHENWGWNCGYYCTEYFTKYHFHFFCENCFEIYCENREMNSLMAITLERSSSKVQYINGKPITGKKISKGKMSPAILENEAKIWHILFDCKLSLEQSQE